MRLDFGTLQIEVRTDLPSSCVFVSSNEAEAWRLFGVVWRHRDNMTICLLCSDPPQTSDLLGIATVCALTKKRHSSGSNEGLSWYNLILYCRAKAFGQVWVHALPFTEKHWVIRTRAPAQLKIKAPRDVNPLPPVRWPSRKQHPSHQTYKAAHRHQQQDIKANQGKIGTNLRASIQHYTGERKSRLTACLVSIERT